MSDMPKIPEHAKMRAFHGGYPDEPVPMTPPNAPTAAERAGEERHPMRFDADILGKEIDRLNAALLAARDETETLLRYVDHLEGCPTRDRYYGKPCSCGLTDTLAALAAAHGEDR